MEEYIKHLYEAEDKSSGDDNGSGNAFTNFFAKIRAFFQRIIDFFKGLFNI